VSSVVVVISRRAAVHPVALLWQQAEHGLADGPHHGQQRMRKVRVEPGAAAHPVTWIGLG